MARTPKSESPRDENVVRDADGKVVGVAKSPSHARAAARILEWNWGKMK
jgi:hypothetical protein